MGLKGEGGITFWVILVSLNTEEIGRTLFNLKRSSDTVHVFILTPKELKISFRIGFLLILHIDCLQTLTELKVMEFHLYTLLNNVPKFCWALESKLKVYFVFRAKVDFFLITNYFATSIFPWNKRQKFPSESHRLAGIQNYKSSKQAPGKMKLSSKWFYLHIHPIKQH